MSTGASLSRRVITWLLLLFSLLPVLLMAIVLVRNWVNIPHMDQWGISRVFDSYHDRGLPVRDLIAQHNESRKALPRLIILGLGLVSGWDVRWEMCFTFMLACLLSFSFYLHLRKSQWLSTNSLLALCAFFNLFIFSPAQRGNWFMGLQLCVFIPPVMLSLGLFSNRSDLPLWAQFLIVIPCALAGTFSFANGMILWLLLIPPGIFSKFKSRPGTGTISSLVLFVIFFISTVFIYFSDYTRPVQSYPMDNALREPLGILRFLLLWISTPLPASDQILLQSVIGATVLVVFLYFTVSLLIRSNGDTVHGYPWIVLGSYSLISGIAASMGRLGFGYGMALSSRYATPALPLTISALALTVVSRHNRSKHPASLSGILSSFHGLILILFITLHVLSYMPGLHRIDKLKARLTRGRAALYLIDVIPGNRGLRSIHTNRRFLEHRFRKIISYDLLDVRPLDPGEFHFDTRMEGRDGPLPGRFKDMTQRTSKRIRVSGWTESPPGAVENQVILFVVTDSRGVHYPADFIMVPDNRWITHGNHMGRRRFGGMISISRAVMDSATVSAWLVDLESSSMLPLAGRHTVVNHPGGSNPPGVKPPAVEGGDIRNGENDQP